MPGPTPKEPNQRLRNLPSVDEVLRNGSGSEYITFAGAEAAAAAARSVIEKLRAEIGSGPDGQANRPALIAEAGTELAKLLFQEKASGLRRVINATGVVIHTNLGRAPLSDEAKAAIVDAAGYCGLEFDLENGKRGRRGGRVETLISELTGAEDSVLVNNGAAAAFFVLHALGAGGEVAISRGELVEIGGDFRIPDVLQASGARLREVGTTNRTKLADYSRVIGADTRMILRVHPSNFRIVGFTATPPREELAALAKEYGIIFYEDLGSGAIVHLAPYGLTDEPTVKEVIAAGVDVVSFSGDKLLGGPQAGILAGRKDLIEIIRKHPLYRVLRPDKLAYAALEATLRAYRRGDARESVPVLQQIVATLESIAERARILIDSIGPLQHLQVDVVDGCSAVGGGAAPAIEIPTRAISLTDARGSARELERRLRGNPPVPIIARIEDDRVLLDLRTVAATDEAQLIDAIRQLDL